MSSLNRVGVAEEKKLTERQKNALRPCDIYQPEAIVAYLAHVCEWNRRPKPDYITAEDWEAMGDWGEVAAILREAQQRLEQMRLHAQQRWEERMRLRRQQRTPT